jgi:hypothetical protein
MKKLTKADIEQFANEIMTYLEKHHLDSDVCIYYNNIRIRNEYDWRIDDAPVIEIVDLDINPFDYFEYANREHILSMSFEGPLYDELNYNYGKCYDALQKIFKKYGCYWELGNAWNLSAYPIDDDMEIEFIDYGWPKKRTTLFQWDIENNPSELQLIMDTWYELSKQVGDKGSCVIGAGFEFTWDGNDYKMCACSPYQGSISWETSKEHIKKMLEDIGASNIVYNWGIMD